MSTINDTVFHATRSAFVPSLRRDGFLVGKHGSRNIYGRGIYFWELEEDAESYGRMLYEDDARIVGIKLAVSRENSIVWDSKYRHEDPDTIARNLIERGKRIVIIPNHLIEDTTFLFAKGDALCYLIDLSA